MRDSQRQRVYDAEGRLRGMFDYTVQYDNPTVEVNGVRLTLPPEAKFGDVASVQRYCDRVCTMAGVPPVAVRERQGEGMAHYEPDNRVIAVPDGRNRWAMREIVVLHELAHHVTRMHNGGVAAHGPEFVTEFIDLLSVVMAPEAALAFRLICAIEGVRWTCSV